MRAIIDGSDTGTHRILAGIDHHPHREIEGAGEIQVTLVVRGAATGPRLLPNTALDGRDGAPPFSAEQADLSPADFYARMQQLINPAGLDPEAAYDATLAALMEQIETRVASVDNGEAYVRAIRRWTCEPILVDGQPVRALGHMRLAFSIELKGRAFQSASIERVTFIDPSGEATSVLGPGAKMHPPRYPMELARQGIGGEVLMAVQTDANGRIVRAATQSGRLYADVRPRDEARAQRAFGQLARASVEAARNWELPGCRSSICTVPVRYTVMRDQQRPTFWWPAHTVAITPEPWMLGGSVVALGANGSASSLRFRPTSKVDGIDVLGVDG